MPITATDKIKINKYIKEHAIGDIYYLDMCEALNKKVKITDIEFLEYFTDYIVNEFKKDSKIYLNHLTKVVNIIDTFLDWINENGSTLKDETIDKIKSFKEYYNDYLIRMNQEQDLEFVGNIDIVLEKINKLYPTIEKSESVIKYINKIEELTKNLNELKKKYEELKDLYDTLESSYNKKNSQVKNLNSDLVYKDEEIRNKAKEIKELSKTIKELNIKIEELKKILSKKEQDIIELGTYKEKFEKLLPELEKLKEQVKNNICSRIREAYNEEKKTKIEDLIYQKLLLGRFNINEILTFVTEQGITTNRDEIIDLLKRIKSKINIDNSVFSLNPSYRIVSPKFLTSEQFIIDLPQDVKYYDILLVSDFHLKEFNQKTLNSFDMINEYCLKNGIKLILNLGDFFQGFGNLTYFDAVQNYKTVEEAIKKIPYADGIYHAVLGGNHDSNILKYGYDPLKLLSDEREDIINLGYSHSIIALRNSSRNILGRFDIHHPDSFDLSFDLDENGINSEPLNNYLNNLYQKQGRNRNSSYIDIFGHMHKGLFNSMDSYYYLPPYFLDNSSNKGACHLRIYIDDNKQIKYMVFMPLTAINQLVKTNEFVYKKNNK